MQTAPATSTLLHQDYLDGWRGLAIALLLIGHFFPVPGINLGSVGVSLFFVLSGFLMGQLLFIKKTPLPLFYRRRISRILPAHLFFIACMSAWFLWSGRDIEVPELLAAIFFVNNYWGSASGPDVIPLGHIWSLSVEEHSYILLSAVALSSRLWGWSANTAIRSICLISMVISVCFWGLLSHTGNAKWLHTEVAGFGIFVSVFCLLSPRICGIRTVGALSWIALFVFGILIRWWSVPVAVQICLGGVALALSVNLLGRAPELVQKALSVRALRMLGLWSYSLYLWQQPFYLMSYYGKMSAPKAITLAFACGLISYYFLEKPCREALNRRWANHR